MADNQQNNFILILLWGMIGLVFMFVMVRILARFPLALLGFLVLVLLGLIGFGVYRFVQRKRAEKVWFKTGEEKAIIARIRQCETDKDRHRKEIEAVDVRLKELRESLQSNRAATREARKKVTDLVTAFEAQRKLRQAKIDFLDRLQKEWEGMLQSFRLQQTLTDNQDELKKLQEQNIEDMVNLEELRTGIEYDRAYWETMDDLSRRMLDTNSLETVQILREELDQMRRDLDE
jgi:xanthosine utilization system XapX-like protein